MKNYTIDDMKPAVNTETGATFNLVFNKDIQMAYVADNEVTRFAGIAKTEFFFRPMVPSKEVDLLVRGFNNRTRERNYFKLYCQLLNNEITDDEFDKEIEENEEFYVVDAGDSVLPEEVCAAVCLTDRLIGIETTDDFTSAFGIDDDSIKNYVKLIGDE